MKKRSLLVVIALLCMASLMASMAYTTAKVTNVAELKVTNTNSALLTLEANTPWSWQDTTGAKDKTVVVKDGELYIQLGKGIAGGNGSPQIYGLQPNSEYQWNPLFTLRNKSAETIKVKISATGELAQYITFGTCGQSSVNDPTWGTQGQSFEIAKLSPETNSGMQNIRNICIKVNIPSKVNFTPEQINESIIVESFAIQP